MSSPVSYLDPVQLQRDLGTRDLSDPAEGPHAIQILISQAVAGLARAWDCEVHTGTPHQLDLWRITRRPMRGADLDQMIAVLLSALSPGLPHRQQPRTHPYTLHGRQVDILRDGSWAEVWECGLAHPRVLAAAGLPGCGGLALGLGLDRLLMLAKDIPDIRLLRSGDPRIARQMQDLAAYRHVSPMPPITRDLSVAVSPDDDEETLGDRVRDALGADASCVEEVRVLSATVRVVLRHLDKTLTNEVANALRDRIYRALHQGTEYQWTGRPSPMPDDVVTLPA